MKHTITPLPSLKRDRTIMGKGNFHDFNANEDNRLLEFTATIDLENKMFMKNTKITARVNMHSTASFKINIPRM